MIIRVKAAAAAEAEERGDKESRGGGQRQTICEGGEVGGRDGAIFSLPSLSLFLLTAVEVK